MQRSLTIHNDLNWRHFAAASVIIGSLPVLMLLPVIRQDPAYHNFADGRALLGIPNFLDVISNLPFLIVGAAGVQWCLRKEVGAMRTAWIVLFAGVSLVSVGSAYYHIAPTDFTLIFDRLPMTIGFMGLFAALLGEHISTRLGRLLLWPLVAMGALSVMYWYWSGDLRPYIWIQAVPLLTIPVMMLLFNGRYAHRWLLLAGLALYLLAKVAEYYDRSIFELTGAVSGHTVKHLLAAAGCLAILVMLRMRRPLGLHQ